jgi:hypothetical protein
VAYAGTTISFPIPLSSAPTDNLIPPHGASTGACPGSATAPSASPGNLCMYEVFSNGVSDTEIFDPTNPLADSDSSSRFGVVLGLESSGSANSFFGTSGSWAVTAN